MFFICYNWKLCYNLNKVNIIYKFFLKLFILGIVNRFVYKENKKVNNKSLSNWM